MLDQLRQSLGLLQVAFDASSDAMLILDGATKVRWANQMAADLWANGMAILLPGRSLTDLTSLHALNGSCLNHGEPSHPLQRMKQGDGEDRYLLPTPELTPHNISWRFIPALKEPFWLMRMRNLAPQEQALFDQQVFLNQLAHELRTPLAIVLGSLQRLERTKELGKKGHHQLQLAREEARRINRLLLQLTLLSELDTGRFRWERCTLPLSTFLLGWLAGLEPEARQRLRVNLDGLDSGLSLHLDQKAFNWVLGNVFDNSLRYSFADASIELRAEQDGTALVLTLIDQGPGIPDDARPGIFDRFRRLERTRDFSRSDGSGLGLAVVKSLVEAMEGSVELLPHGTGDAAGGLGVQMRWPVASAG